MERADKMQSINYLWNCNNEKLWLKALDKYWQMLKGEQLLLERKIDALDCKAVEQMTSDEFFAFLFEDFYAWKYTNKLYLKINRNHLWKYYSEQQMKELGLIKDELFNLDFEDIKQSIKCASRIRGLGTAGASALLSVLFPEYFGTVDQFAVISLRKVEDLKEHYDLEKMNPNNLNLKDSVLLINIMKNKAKELNELFETNFWTPRKIDMVLWSVER